MDSSSGDDHDYSEDDYDFEIRRPAGPIPEDLHSVYEERAFKTCTRCGEGLEDFEDGYRISKVYRAGEVIFEYALCVPCLKNMMEESSEESRERLMKFQEENFRYVSGFDECALCDTSRDDPKVKEFGLVGMCQGTGLLDSNMICGGCMEKMSELVSKQTRSSWDRFVEENFPGVPSDFEPMPTNAPVQIV